MAQIRPFKGVRYNLDRVNAGEVVSPPYDVIDDAYRQALYDRHGNNVVRIIQGKPESGDGSGSNCYTRAASDYAAWKADGVLVQDPEASFYVCEQTFDVETHWGRERKTRQGLVALVHIERLGEGTIYPHEHTMPGPKADRLALMEHTEGAFGQIFSLYSDPQQAVAGLLKSSRDGAPLFSFEDDEAVVHAFWRVSSPDVVAGIRSFFYDRDLFIADGHHRYETAVNYRDGRFKEEGEGDRSYAYSMQTLVNMDDSEGMAIKPIHRVVYDLGPSGGAALSDLLDPWFTRESEAFAGTDQVLAAIEERSAAAGRPVLAGLMGDVQRVVYFTLRAGVDLGAIDPAGRSDAWHRLDSGLLHLVLGKALDLDDETLTKGEKVQFIKVESEVGRLVAEDDGRAGFYLSPVSMQQLRDVVLAGERMPPKSTFFYPKVFTGLVMQDFREF